MSYIYIHDLPAEEQEDREVWAFEPHRFDDDGFPAKCRQFDMPLDVSNHIETGSGVGTALCPSCQQTAIVISLNG